MKSTKIQSNMRTRITLIICLCLFAVGRASAQLGGDIEAVIRQLAERRRKKE